jgi:hypothetical protein
MSEGAQPAWPSGVRELGVGDLKRLGIDRDNQIYWDGRRIEIRKAIVLTGFQKIIALIVTVVGVLAGLSTIATGFNNASIFLCARHIAVLTCPAP